MSQETAIGWTDLSWNPVHGCSIVSTECKFCYAATLSQRYGQTLKPWTPANAAENVLLKPHKLREPLSNAKAWRGPGAAAAAAGKTDGKLVFVNSMSDLFHEQIPDEYIAEVFAVMAMAQRHDFQVLTKRPERMQALLTDEMWWPKVGDAIYARDGDPEHCSALWTTHGNATWLSNVWLGVSIGLRHFVGRADLLRQTPAAVRFISAEPLLGPLDDTRHLRCEGCRWVLPIMHTDENERCSECGHHFEVVGERGLDLTGIDWLIVGGESGPGHRPMDPQWARDLRDAAQATRIGDERPDCAFFFKRDRFPPRPGPLPRWQDLG